MYKIVRYAHGHRPRTVRVVPTEALAQEICHDPETSSRTCKGKAAKARTRRLGGPWFFGYTECRK